MNIAFLHRDLPPAAFAGVAVQVHRLAQALATMNHSVTIFTLSPKPEGASYAVRPWDFSGLAFCRRVLPRWKRLWAPLGCRFLDFSEFDVVHVHGDGGFLRYDSRFVRTFYGTAALEARHARGNGRLAQGFSYVLEKREARRGARLTAISPHVRDFLPNIRWIIPCMTAQAPDPEALRHKAETPTLIYVGARGGRKRGEWALSLWQTLRPEFPDLVLHYVGPECDRAAVAAADAAGLRFHTRLPERELMDLYRCAWIAVFFSSYEGFGVPWAEALSQGCCVVSTPHAGAREWLCDGDNACLRPPEAVATAVASLLREQSSREALARQGLQTAAAFAPERVAAAYLEIYRAGGMP